MKAIQLINSLNSRPESLSSAPYASRSDLLDGDALHGVELSMWLRSSASKSNSSMWLSVISL
jgi:hypothetical protein